MQVKEVRIDLSHLTDDELEELDMAVTVARIERDTEFWQEIEEDREEKERFDTTIKQWGNA